MNDNAKENMKSRSPIVVIMGHVDHGKTTLLDYIRKTSVASREAGGITQAIGAYEIEHVSKNLEPKTSNLKPRKITFIDTPGHEAFTKMRSRGAQAADLAILVVAAEESLKPQTKEAIKILNDTKTTFIVAINKVDKPEANVEKVKNDLTAEGVLLEGYGGSISFQPISAKTGQGVEELLDLILLATDLENLTYDPAAPASGYIVEAKIDPRRGLEVSVILKNGILKTGSEICTSSAKGKVKIMENFLGERMNEAIPSAPVLIIGFEKLPAVGEEFCTDAEKISPEKSKEAKITSNLPAQLDEDENHVHLIIKAGDAGSLEVASAILRNLKSEKEIVVLDESVGDIGDAEIKAAIASEAVVVGFKNKVTKTSRALAEIHKVKILTSDIIYELIKSVEKILAAPIAAALRGRLGVLAVFNQQKLQKQLVGGKVVEGSLRNRAQLEIRREGKVVGSGKIINLQSQKADVDQVGEGKECGVVVNSSFAIAVGDELVIK